MSQHPGQRLLPTLRHWRDWQSVFYMLILPLIVTCMTSNATAQALGGRPI